jgi:hypothetical protein
MEDWKHGRRRLGVLADEIGRVLCPARCPVFGSHLHPPLRPARLQQLSVAVPETAWSNFAAVEFVRPEPIKPRAEITFADVEGASFTRIRFTMLPSRLADRHYSARDDRSFSWTLSGRQRFSDWGGKVRRELSSRLASSDSS